jgi:hypothetical protein
LNILILNYRKIELSKDAEESHKETNKEEGRKEEIEYYSFFR